jgi:nucleoside-diphosphate-sugar epimerase
MRVLVTGGSGVIGDGLIPELLAGGHQVRLLSRHAEESRREWPEAVESFEADVTNADQLSGAADGCEAVVHIAGIVAEVPPDITFDLVNVGGTDNLLKEASRSSAPRFIFISSLAAERGASAYHKSKRDAEALVRTYHGPWIILRPGNVYGPGDEVMSRLLSMQRTLPVIPLIGNGTHPFQPVWYIDLGKAIRRATEAKVATGVYEVAGEEVTTANGLLDRLEELTGRSPLRVPVPEFLAGLTVRAAQAMGLPFPISESQFQMIIEHSVIEPAENNALRRVFQVEPTSLASGLKILADVQPEQEPAEGVGKLERKRFIASIKNSRLTAEELLESFRQRCTELMPIQFDAEPGAPREVVKGASLTAAVPLRGNIQIRVEEVTPRTVTFATLRGHPLAGVVRFSTSGSPESVVQFEVVIFVRAATVFDWVALKAGGQVAQDWTWRTVVERVIEISGGSSDSVQEEQELVADTEIEGIEAWIRDLVTARKREERNGSED